MFSVLSQSVLREWVQFLFRELRDSKPMAQPKQNNKKNVYYAELIFRIHNSSQAILCQRILDYIDGNSHLHRFKDS